jgi:hypothetical protein
MARRSTARNDVVNMPPPWRRSLTESGMDRVTSRLDRIAVAVFFLVVLAGVALLVYGS